MAALKAALKAVRKVALKAERKGDLRAAKLGCSRADSWVGMWDDATAVWLVD